MKRIAIVGSGIAGLSTAYHLHDQYDITVFEQHQVPGGHTDTHTFAIDGTDVRIDSGFIIFCPEFYPNFSAMLDQLGVASKPTDMSFSAHNKNSGLVYNATSLRKLFCQPSNLGNTKFIRMLLDLVRFYSTSTEVLKNDDVTTTVKEYLDRKKYGLGFQQDHLIPMISALWSTTPATVEKFPIRHLVEFFRNHGLLKLVNRPQWRVIENGSASYVEALQAQLKCDWKLGRTVTLVERSATGIEITTRQDLQPHKFDAVVFAAHADQILAMLASPTDAEQSVLSAMPFEQNHVVVHTDETIMHPNKNSWASWNTEVPLNTATGDRLRCTANYWMNSLQGLSLKTNVFTTLNSQSRINPKKVLAERHYTHPIFTAESVVAQKQKSRLDGQNRSYFVGAYWGWGFHEDGARTAANVSQLIRDQI